MEFEPTLIWMTPPNYGCEMLFLGHMQTIFFLQKVKLGVLPYLKVLMPQSWWAKNSKKFRRSIKYLAAGAIFSNPYNNYQCHFLHLKLHDLISNHAIVNFHTDIPRKLYSFKTKHFQIQSLIILSFILNWFWVGITVCILFGFLPRV